MKKLSLVETLGLDLVNYIWMESDTKWYCVENYVENALSLELKEITTW